jgi:hypothetical protein
MNKFIIIFFSLFLLNACSTAKTKNGKVQTLDKPGFSYSEYGADFYQCAVDTDAFIEKKSSQAYAGGAVGAIGLGLFNNISHLNALREADEKCKNCMLTKGYSVVYVSPKEADLRKRAINLHKKKVENSN